MRIRPNERERERKPGSPPHVCLHLFQFTCCRLPRCRSAPSPPRSHVVVLPHFHPYSPISSTPYLHPIPLPRAHLPLDSVGTAQCHVTALEMYRKRRCTDNVTTRLYSPAASLLSPLGPFCFPRAVLPPIWYALYCKSILCKFPRRCNPRFPCSDLVARGKMITPGGVAKSRHSFNLLYLSFTWQCSS
jgi:hypothetical protein